jgi:hypothetical protein
MSAGLAAGARTILRCNHAVLELDQELDRERDQDMSAR